MLEVGHIDTNIVKLLQLNGYNTILAFKGHFLRNITEDELINSIVDLVKNMPENSEGLKELNLTLHEKNNFQLAQGEIGTILGLFEAMKSICERPEAFPPNPTSSNSSPSPATSRSIPSSAIITAANAASVVKKFIRRRLGSLINDEDNDVEVLRSYTQSFPFRLGIKCIKCSKTFNVTISKDKRRENYFNVQTQSYIGHVKKCTGSV
jgi:hypothetical protein